MCQSRIARFLRVCSKPIYLSKRDISDFFASVNHEILLQQLGEHIEPGDYLHELACQRVRFLYHDEEGSHQAGIGIPFGCASACVLANIYLTEFDPLIEKIDAIRYFRYSDDMLLLSQDREAAHRHRLIVHGEMERAFFIWQRQKEARALKGTVARLAYTERDEQPSLRAQKQQPIMPVREGGCL